MGDGVPHSLRMRFAEDGAIVGVLRDLTKIAKAIDDVAHISLDFARGGQDVLKILDDIYQSRGGPSPDGGNATDLTSDRLPGHSSDRAPSQSGVPGPDQQVIVIRDGRPVRVPGPGIPYDVNRLPFGLKDASLRFRLKDIKLLPDFRTLTLTGDAKATLDIATDYPAAFDSPTEIGLKITSTSISPSQVGVVGSASVYKVFHGDFKLQLHYDIRQLVEAIARFAWQRKLTRSQVEQLLRRVSFDASAIVKADFLPSWLPLSVIKLSASSILPLRHPLIGATDELLPVQLASMPDREMFIGGLQVVPKGVFFDVPVPALGLHYSKYGRSQGFSGTLAGLAKPDMSNLGQVQAFGYVDLHYAKRVTNAVDIDIGMTYTISPSSAAGTNEDLQLQYLRARSKPWLPTSRDNMSPDADRSGQNFMFNIKGTFDAL